MSNLRVKPNYALLMDDVRREDNGKLIFIGVYTGSMVVQSYPVSLALSFYINGTYEGHGTTSLELRMRLQPEGLVLFGIQAKLERRENAPSAERFEFSANGIAIQVQRDGMLSLELRHDNDTWAEVTSIPVVKNATTSSSVSQQPS